MTTLKELYKKKVKQIDKGTEPKKYASIKFIAPLLFILGAILITFLIYQIDFSALLKKLPYIEETKNCTLTVNLANGSGVVTIDGQQAGTTPLSGYKVSCELHTVELKKTGEFSDFYATHTESVDFPQNSSLTITATIGPTKETTEVLKYLEEPYSGLNLFLFSVPTNMLALVDGAMMGETPVYTDSISPGQHTITLRREGYKESTIVIELKDDRKVTITAQLMKSPIDEGAK